MRDEHTHTSILTNVVGMLTVWAHLVLFASPLPVGLTAPLFF